MSTSDPHPPDDRTGPTGSAPDDRTGPTDPAPDDRTAPTDPAPDDRTGPTDPAPDDRRAAGDDPADAAALAAYATALADAVEAAIPRWVDRSVRRVLAAQHIAADDRVAAAIAGAAGAARDEGAPRVRALLATDVDRQGGTPLAILRTLVRHPTAVLRDAGARPVARDEFSVRNFPDDAYDLTPASFGDLDPALHEPGIVWGAAKAHVHLARRRREGMR